jgi:tRNA A-37 threonylcarbamoyl transferase component Bud32
MKWRFYPQTVDSERLRNVVSEHEDILRGGGEPVCKDDHQSAITLLRPGADRESGLVVKQYRYKGPLYALKNAFRSSRAEKSFRAAECLLGRGILTPRPVAWIERSKGGLPHDCFYIMESIPDSVELDRYVIRKFQEQLSGKEAARKRRFLRAFCHELRRLREKAVFHADLRTCNILVREGGGAEWEFYFIDLDKVLFDRTITPARIVRNLAQINSSTPPCISSVERLRFFKCYFGLKHLGQREKSLIAEIWERCRKRRWVYYTDQGVIIREWK